MRRWLEQGPLLDRFLGERAFVESCLNNQPVFEGLLEKRDLLERCLVEQGRLEFYLDTRESLRCFNIEEGSVLFSYEHEFLKNLVDTANTYPGRSSRSARSSLHDVALAVW